MMEGRSNSEISFLLNSQFQLFDGSSNALVNSRFDIVASSASFGLVFTGSTNAEIIVTCLKDLEVQDALTQPAPVRNVQLPSVASHIATNCDGSLLAVAFKSNGTPQIQLFSVASFLTPNIQKLGEFQPSADNSEPIQICWNPVLSLVLAICTDSGGLHTYSLTDDRKFHFIDQNLKAKCCCWSPKGKQIVAGFGNGKLVQFTTELEVVKTIDGPTGSFDAIAIQWLSTFQFAVAFQSHQRDARPVLHIVNAPEFGQPQFIAYNDVCFSSTEQRPSRIYMRHIPQWNILLVASANAIDVKILRVSQPGDFTIWTVIPMKLPLSSRTDETFPVGFELDTACSGRLLQEDGSPYPAMPMIHILSTAGFLCSFYVLNRTQGIGSICSPPRSIDVLAMSLFKREQQKVAQTPMTSFMPPSKNTKTDSAKKRSSTAADKKIAGPSSGASVRGKFRKSVESQEMNNAIEKLCPFLINSSANVNDHQSLAYLAAKNEQFDVYGVFATRNIQLRQKDVEKLTIEIKEKLRVHMKKDFKQSDMKHLKTLILKSKLYDEVSPNQKEILLKIIEKAFEKLNEIEEIEPILRIVACAENLELMFDFGHSSIIRMDPTKTNSTRGTCYYNLGDLYFATEGLMNDGADEYWIDLGAIAHEMCHLAMNFIYNNDCKPYAKGNLKKKEIFGEILRLCHHEKGREWLISNVYEYPEAERINELIVRVPQILTFFRNNESELKARKEIFEELFEFYENNVMRDLKLELPRMEAKKKVKELSMVR